MNEELVQLLLVRDELHTEQDAMLVDIEDLTRSVIVALPEEAAKPGLVSGPEGALENFLPRSHEFLT